MNVSNAARSVLANVPGANQAIDLLCARINEVFSAQHDNETGAHTNITAESIEITGTDESTFGGAGTFDGNVTADADQDPVEIGRTLGTSAGTEGAIGNGLSVRSTPTQTFGFDVLAQNGTFKEVRFQWRTATTNENPLRIRSEPGTPAWHVMPGPVTNGIVPVYLGSPTDSFRGGFFAGVYANAFYRNSATVAEGDFQTYTPTWANLTVGNGTVTATWAQVGHVTYVDITVVFGSTTTIASGVTFTLPTNNTNITASQQLGDAVYLDASLSQGYSGVVLVSGADKGTLLVETSPYVFAAAAVPFLWTTSDVLTISLAYQNT